MDNIKYGIIYIITLFCAILFVLLLHSLKHLYDTINDGHSLMVVKDTFIGMSRHQNKMSYVYFNGCNTIKKLEKRHKYMCQALHPDQNNGDLESFKLMEEEYTFLYKKLKK